MNTVTQLGCISKEAVYDSPETFAFPSQMASHAPFLFSKRENEQKSSELANLSNRTNSSPGWERGNHIILPARDYVKPTCLIMASLQRINPACEIIKMDISRILCVSEATMMRFSRSRSQRLCVFGGCGEINQH